MASPKRAKVILPVNPKKRSELLKKTFLGLEGDYAQRMSALIEMTGIQSNTLYTQGRRHNWKKEMQIQHDLKVTAQEMSEVERIMPDAPKDVSFSAIQGNIKDFSYLMVHTTKHVSEVAAKMILYYSDRITKLLNEVAGNMDRMTSVQAMRLEMYEKKLLQYQNMITEYIKPSAVAKYLDLIGFSDAIGVVPDGMEMGMLTPQKLLGAIAKVGFTNVVGNLEISEEIKKTILEEGIELPEVDARKVQDLVNRINMGSDEQPAQIMSTTVTRKAKVTLNIDL